MSASVFVISKWDRDELLAACLWWLVKTLIKPRMRLKLNDTSTTSVIDLVKTEKLHC